MHGADSGDQQSGCTSLSRKPLAPAWSASIDVFVHVERGQHDDPRAAGAVGQSRRVASMPSMPGIRTSISTTSGRSCAASSAPERRRGLAGDGEVRLDLEDHPESGPHQRLVVDDEYADGAGAWILAGALAGSCRLQRQRGHQLEAALRPRPRDERAAVDRDPLAHAEQAVAGLGQLGMPGLGVWPSSRTASWSRSGP